MRGSNTVVGLLLVYTFLLLSACGGISAPNDEAITEQIQAKLYQDQTLKTRDISVVTQGGTVVLTGQVQSEDEKAAAEKVASQGAGVKKVVNDLALSGVLAPSLAPPTSESPTKPAASPTRPRAPTK